MSWSNGLSPFSPLNSAKITTCLVVSSLYEITAGIVTLHLTGYITPPYIDSVSTSTIYVLDSRSRRNRYGLLGSLTPEPLFVKRPDPTTTPLHHHLCAYYIKRLNVTYRTTHIFYLWLRPAQTGDGLRNLLTPGNTELGETSGTRNFLSLTSCCLCLWRRPAILATARSTRIFYLWRRPAQPGDGRRDRDRDRVSFIFGDGQRNLATAHAIC